MNKRTNGHVLSLTLAVSLTLGIGAFGLEPFLATGVLNATLETALYFLLVSAILALSYLLFIYSSHGHTGESAQRRR